MIRRSVARGLGGYDPTLAVYEDVDFFCRGILQYGHDFVDAPVLRYSTGLPSIIHDLDDEVAAIAEAYAQIHAGVRQRHGTLRYRVLQVAAKLLPVGNPYAA